MSAGRLQHVPLEQLTDDEVEEEFKELVRAMDAHEEVRPDRLIDAVPEDTQ